MIATKAYQVFNVQQLVNAKPCFRPAVTYIPEKNKVVILTIKTSAVQALPQSPVCPMYITHYKCSAHFTFGVPKLRSVIFQEANVDNYAIFGGFLISNKYGICCSGQEPGA
jgi:hypothetical protein